MLSFQTIQLLHRHVGGANERMVERSVDSYDPERALGRGELRGARIFRCEVCADEVIVQPAEDPTDERRPI